MNKKIGKKPAYSLIFAFVFITVMLIVSTTVITNVRGKIDYFENIEAASKARAAAESAAESAILLIKDEEAGYEPDAAQVYPDGLTTDTYGIYQVYSRAEENTNLGGAYYTPYPNTGNAAPFGECSVLEEHEDPDHACNWNKLTFGSSATIPLYANDGSSNLNPSDLGLDAWYLRVRTPCSNGSYAEDCDGGDRYELDGDSSDYDNDNNIILWQLIGYDSTGATVVSEVPSDDKQSGRFGAINRDYTGTTNTEIYESLINSATDNIVLEANSTSSDSRYSDLYTTCTDSTIETLILQLDVVNQLVDADTAASVPYLEWQLVWEGSEAPADTKATIVGRGYHESLLGTFLYPFVITRSTVSERAGSYTISN